MKVRVLMFGALADTATKEDVFELDDDATAGDVVRAVGDRYSRAVVILRRSSVAVNQEIVPAGHRVRELDEVALLPPSSGGAISVRLCASPGVTSALDAVATGDAGGTVLFVGTVRASCDAGTVERLEYSAYDAMAERVMREIAEEAVAKWDLVGIAVEHSVGSRFVGETTFVVACAGAHRDEAFEACRYVVDEVKRRAPIWKRELGPWGDRWVGL